MSRAITKSKLVDTATAEKQKLIVVRNPVEASFLHAFGYVIPGIYILRALVEYTDVGGFPDALLDFVKIPTEIALIIALVFSNLLFSMITTAVPALFANNIVSQKPGDESITSDSFIKYFDFWLNRRIRMLAGFLSASLIFTYYVFTFGGLSELFRGAGFSLSYVDTLLYIFPSVIYGYFVGVVVWKLCVTSIVLRSIPNKFEVHVKFGHPDGAGGLLPIGQLCLQMIYVTVIPTILSALILLAPLLAPPKIAPYVIANTVLFLGLSPLILFAGIVGSVLAFIPLFKFHQVMLDHKMEMIETLNRVSERIIALKTDVLNLSNSADQKSADDLVKNITALETFYEAHQNISTWPINKQILASIWGTQIFLLGQVAAIWDLIRKFIPNR